MNKLNPVNQTSFENIPVSLDWSFENIRSTEQWTHGYHRYPAKFLPNIVKKLIEEYTTSSDTVADLFAGCGTTLVEAKIHGRKSIGVDINPIAELITKVKTHPIAPDKLSKYCTTLNKRIVNYDESAYYNINVHEKIDYWFFPQEKYKIAFLYKRITLIRDEEVKNFYLVALSNILKNCSRWLQSSTKPQIDPNKIPNDPFIAFNNQVKKMVKKNKEFYEELTKSGFLNTLCEIQLGDARTTAIKSDSITAIITSPPYVTSYEYADIHQLSGYWYNYIDNLAVFRKNFMGTFYSLNQETKTSSETGQKIVDELNLIDKRTAKEVANYFNDMLSVSKEMYRILKPGGHICLVIGNTTYLNVKIKSAETFAELINPLGFKVINIIKRSIPYKLIPTIRDKQTGKFSKLDSKNSQLVYPEEYIIIAKKKYGNKKIR